MFRWWCSVLAWWYAKFNTDPKQIPVAKLHNINNNLCAALEKIKVRTRADLVQLGALETYSLLLQHNPQHQPNLVLQLHGAITQMPWQHINQKQQAYLLEEAAALQHGLLLSRD